MSDDGLSVIVCVYNGAARVARFVKPLADTLAAASFPTELIVVDDGSQDQSAATVQALDAGIHLHRHGVNRGPAAARNSGAQLAHHSWLAFLDDDVEITPIALEALWQARSGQGCVVPEIRDLDGQLQNAF